MKIANTLKPSSHIKPLSILVSVIALLVAAGPAVAKVIDTTPPVLAVPADVHYQLKQKGAIVRMTYRIVVADDLDPHPRTTCLPKSGSPFPIGTTKITCTAKDAAGNTARDSFRITVKRAK